MLDLLDFENVWGPHQGGYQIDGEDLSVNYPVLRQNKRVLLNTFRKHHGRKIQHCTSIQEARMDREIECTERILMTVVFYECIQ